MYKLKYLTYTNSVESFQQKTNLTADDLIKLVIEIAKKSYVITAYNSENEIVIHGASKSLFLQVDAHMLIKHPDLLSAINSPESFPLTLEHLNLYLNKNYNNADINLTRSLLKYAPSFSYLDEFRNVKTYNIDDIKLEHKGLTYKSFDLSFSNDECIYIVTQADAKYIPLCSYKDIVDIPMFSSWSLDTFINITIEKCVDDYLKDYE